MLTRGIMVLVSASLALSAAGPVSWIEALGGKTELDPKGNIIAVNLRGAWVNDVELIDLSHLPNLQRLDLSHTRITDEGMLHLKTATAIRELNLMYAELVTDQGMSAIRNWKMLKRLNLRGTRVSNGTLEIVGRLPQIEALDIANTQVTDNGLDQLIALTNLKELALGRSRVGESELGFLRMLPSLTSLDLSGARPVPPDMSNAARRKPTVPPLPQKTIEALSQLANLRKLKLGYSGVSASDLKTLSTLQNVEKLGLEECSRVDDQAAAELANWKSLKYVDLQGTHVTAQGIQTLRIAKPGLTILSAPTTPKPE
jgi:internalin A